MRTAEYLLNDLKPLDTEVSVGETLEMMNELKLSHLPVVHENRYVGLVSDEDFQDISQLDSQLDRHLQMLKPYQIGAEDHLYNAVALMGEGQLSLLPVTDNQESYLGYLSPLEVIQDWGHQLTFREPGSLLVLRIPVRDYHLSQLAQIVESQDGRIVGLQMSSDGLDNLRLFLKVNLLDCSSLMKNLERFEYEIVEVYHKSLFDDSASDRYEALMRYLNF